MSQVTWLESFMSLHFLQIPCIPGCQEGPCAFYIAMDGKIGTHTLFTLMESIYFSHIVSENLKNSGGPT